jgi:hypothetical protein
MTRVLIEYFKPDPREPGAFPLGVIAQDDRNIVYRLFEPRRLHLEKFPEFHLEARVDVMRGNVLIPSFRSRMPSGEMHLLAVTDPEFLEALASRGDGYFRYGRIWIVEDLDAESAANLIATLPQEDFERIQQDDTLSTLRQLQRLVG